MTTVQTTRLRAGYVLSCGCLLADFNRRQHQTHAKSRTPEYRAWINMRLRCYSDKDIGYSRYGGRGIRVDARWMYSFETFFADVGLRPSRDHSLERINTNGNYEPNNVCWATREAQSNNKRTNVNITVGTTTKTASEWGRLAGLQAQTIKARIQRGWSTEKAVSLPPLIVHPKR